MSATLAQLSEEYFQAARDMDETIAKYRKLLNAAYKAGNYLKTYEIKRKLTVFYDQKRDIITTAYQLKHYYDRKEDADESYSIVS